MSDVGLIGLSKDPGLYQSAIRLFTGKGFKASQITHSFITIDRLYSQRTVLEAWERVHIVPFDRDFRGKESKSWVVFKLVDDSLVPKQVEEAARRTYIDTAGSLYGFASIPWFIIRWISSIFGKDIRGSKNWFGKGVVCSEIPWLFLWHLGGKYRELITSYQKDSFHSQDLLDVIKANPKMFKMLECEGDKEFLEAIHVNE